jgi:hypothetical protein
MSGHGTPRVPPAVAVAYPPNTTPLPSNFGFAGTYLASAALPAAGAYTAPQAMGVPVGTKRVTFWITYTRGAAGGYPVFKPQFLGNGVGIQMSGNTMLDLSSFAAAAPLGAVNFYVEQLKGPAPSDGNALSYQLTFELPAFTVGCELLAAEEGVVGTPGTIEILYTLEG